MIEQQALAFLAQLETLCEKAGAYCDISLKKKPKLEHVRVEINIKVGIQNDLDNLIKNGVVKT